MLTSSKDSHIGSYKVLGFSLLQENLEAKHKIQTAHKTFFESEQGTFLNRWYKYSDEGLDNAKCNNVTV